MATPRVENLINQLKPVLHAIHALEPASLVQKDRLGSELSFEHVLSLFVEITASAGKLLSVDLASVPYNALAPLLQPFSQIQALLAAIRSFSPAGNGAAERENLINNLDDNWGQVYVFVRALLGANIGAEAKKDIDLLTSQIHSTMRLSSDAVAALTERKAEIDRNLDGFLQTKSAEFAKAGEDRLKEVSAALDQVRKAAAETGVSQTSVYFKIEAGEHLVAARVWLVVLAALILALILFSLYGAKLLNLAGSPEPTTATFDVFQAKYIAQKGLIVFCLFFGLIGAAKNYGASRHNYVVNKHRNNALGSFQAFASSAADDQTKSAVLIQATQSIFTPQPSGYVKSDGDNSSATPIIEILRSVGTAKDK